MKVNIITSKEERDQAFHLRRLVFVDEQHVPLEEELDQYEDDAIHFIGIQDHVPIAASRLRWIDNYGKLERICIRKDYRGQSYGKYVIEVMEQTIREHGYSLAKLGAQTHAITFYERLGYQIVSDVFMDAGIPHVTMSKLLV